jgi:hypothetical protein
MDWEIIGAVGEILSALAVVGSLLYVGRQFRHSSTYSLDTIYFQSIQNFSSSPENASLVYRGDKDYASLTDEERFHYGLFHYNHFTVSELIYFQYKRGLIHRTSAARAMRALHFYRSQPGFDIYWQGQLKHYLDPEFVAAIESGELVEDAERLPTDMGASYQEQRSSTDR